VYYLISNYKKAPYDFIYKAGKKWENSYPPYLSAIMDECDVELISEQRFNALATVNYPRVRQYQYFDGVVQVKKYQPAKPLDNIECTCYPKPPVQEDYEQEYLVPSESSWATPPDPEKVEIPIDSQPEDVLTLTDLAITPESECQAPDVPLYEVSQPSLTIPNPHVTLPKISHPPPVVKGVCASKKVSQGGLTLGKSCVITHARTPAHPHAQAHTHKRTHTRTRYCHIKYHKNSRCQGVDKKDFCAIISRLIARKIVTRALTH
jgi:hypothetical protein